MRYEILGSVRVLDQDVFSPISTRKLEILLATLLIRRGHVVSTNHLITEIWGENPPRQATAALHVYISQLRKFVNRQGQVDSAIVTRSPGYSLLLRSDELDFDEFQALVNSGRARIRNQQYEEAAADFESALELWRGPVLHDLRDGPIVNGFATWVEEIRLESIEMMVSSFIMLDRHRELIGLLYSLIVDHPLHEEFYRQLMLALYRSGRRADALKVYWTARETLRGELGLEPSGALRKLQRSILAADENIDLRPAM